MNKILFFIFVSLLGVSVSLSTIAGNSLVTKETITLINRTYHELEEAEKTGDLLKVAQLQATLQQLLQGYSPREVVQTIKKKKKNSTAKQIRTVAISVGIALPLIVIAWKLAFLIVNNHFHKDARSVRNDLAQGLTVLRADVQQLFQAASNRIDSVAQAAHNDSAIVAQGAQQLLGRAEHGMGVLRQDVKETLTTFKWFLSGAVAAGSAAGAVGLYLLANRII